MQTFNSGRHCDSWRMDMVGQNGPAGRRWSLGSSPAGKGQNGSPDCRKPQASSMRYCGPYGNYMTAYWPTKYGRRRAVMRYDPWLAMLIPIWSGTNKIRPVWPHLDTARSWMWILHLLGVPGMVPNNCHCASHWNLLCTVHSTELLVTTYTILRT